jgi:hypothetical protein
VLLFLRTSGRCGYLLLGLGGVVVSILSSCRRRGCGCCSCGAPWLRVSAYELLSVGLGGSSPYAGDGLVACHVEGFLGAGSCDGALFAELACSLLFCWAFAEEEVCVAFADG